MGNCGKNLTPLAGHARQFVIPLLGSWIAQVGRVCPCTSISVRRPTPRSASIAARRPTQALARERFTGRTRDLQLPRAAVRGFFQVSSAGRSVLCMVGRPSAIRSVCHVRRAGATLVCCSVLIAIFCALWSFGVYEKSRAELRRVRISERVIVIDAPIDNQFSVS